MVKNKSLIIDFSLGNGSFLLILDKKTFAKKIKNLPLQLPQPLLQFPPMPLLRAPLPPLLSCPTWLPLASPVSSFSKPASSAEEKEVFSFFAFLSPWSNVHHGPMSILVYIQRLVPCVSENTHSK